MRKKNKNIGFWILPVFFALSVSVSGQWDTTWTRTYGGFGDDKAFDMIATSDGGFMLTGITSSFGFDNAQMYFLKLDSLGLIQWSRSYGGPGQEAGYSVIQTADNGYLAVGYSNSTGQGGYDFFLVKLDSNGGFEYQKTLGGPDWEFAYDVREYAPGEYIIAGETYSFGNGQNDGWILKFDEAGQQVSWDITIGDSLEDFIRSVAILPGGDLVVAGAITPNDSDNTDLLFARIKGDGSQVVWQMNYGKSFRDYSADIILLSNGNLAAINSIEENPAKKTLWPIGLDVNGNILWTDTWNAPQQNGPPQKIIEVDNGKMAFCSFFDVFQGNTDVYAGICYPNGVYFAGTSHGGLQIDEAYGIVYKPGNGYYIAGTSTSYTNPSFDVLLLRVDSLLHLNDSSLFEFIEDIYNVTAIENTQPETVPRVYYDPVGKSLHFQCNEPLKGRLYIYDMRGIPVITMRIAGTDVKIETNNLPGGIYIVQFLSEKGEPLLKGKLAFY